MNPEQEWDQIRNGRNSAPGAAGTGVLRVTLLFGSAAVALALVVAPLAANHARGSVAGADRSDLDMMSTGSTGGQRAIYTIRRSVLQASPDSVCIIRPNGARHGDC